MQALLDQGLAACSRPAQRERLRRHIFSQLVCLGQHTVTGLLTTTGRLDRDWSADYRLYAASRVHPQALFEVLRQGVEAFLKPEAPLVACLDDSLLHKTGRRIPGAGWRRDPLGPKFQTNFVWAQRVLQLSAALPLGNSGAARLIPVDFQHAPTAPRPRKTAPPEEWQAYRRQQKQLNLGTRAVERLQALARRTSRPLHAVGDGGYTNKTVLRALPARTVFIGRIRADAKLHGPAPPPAQGPGRPRRYGPVLPTPDQIRQADLYPWEYVRAFAAGKEHEFRVKVLRNVLWRAAGADLPLALIIVAPLHYRLAAGRKLLYRKPAFLICTQPAAAVPQILQEYLWRSEIEVNFREEKALLGVGQAQVRDPASVENVPACAVAAYGLLLLAAAQAYGPTGLPDALPTPRWRRREKPARATTNALIRQLRYELWGRILDPNFSDFATRRHPTHKPQKTLSPTASAVLYPIRA